MSVAFVRSNHTINVKYEHTPIHKTVSQLFEFFWPSVPESAPVPKTQRTKSTRIKKRDGPVDDENRQTRKKCRKEDKYVAVTAPGTPMARSDIPGALSVGDKGRMSYGAHQMDAGAHGFSKYPDGLMGDSSGSTTDGTASIDVLSSSVSNVPLTEPSKGCKYAVKIPSDGDVDSKRLGKGGGRIISCLRCREKHRKVDRVTSQSIYHRELTCLQCLKEQPGCSNCVKAGEECVYPVWKQGKRKTGIGVDIKAAPATSPIKRDDLPDLDSTAVMGNMPPLTRSRLRSTLSRQTSRPTTSFSPALPD